MRATILCCVIAVSGCGGSSDEQATSGEVDSTSAEVATESSVVDTASSESASDASAADTSPSEVAADTKPVDSCVGRLVCDDFEKATLGGKPAAPFVVSTNKGSVTIDGTHAYSGKNAVKVSIEATSSSDAYRRAFMNLKGAPLLPIADNTVYGRFMIWTDRIPDKSVHWTIAHGDGPVSGGLRATYNYGGMGGLMANYYKNSAPDPTDCWQTKSQAFPTGKWACVRFMLDGKNSEMRFWLDGAEIPELHVTGMSKTDATCTVKGVDGKWYAPSPFENVSLGWESYQHDTVGKHDAWIDDVILDDTPIDCP